MSIPARKKSDSFQWIMISLENVNIETDNGTVIDSG